ncbi:MAG: ATP-binding protein [Deltaproteobacteria bacterium]
MNPIIERKIYIDRIKPFIGKSLIKVLTGQRRVGKSYLLLQLIEKIKIDNPKIQIIYINKELHEFRNLKNSDDLFNYLNLTIKPNNNVGLFIDEIQDIKSFEIVLRDLITRNNIDIYCTGSNANLLSGELATLLSGRYIEIKVYSLSYSEFLLFHKLESNQDSFNRFLKNGGLPYLINLANDSDVIYEYLKSIYNTVILKDVVGRYNLRSVQFMENLVVFLADNIGNLVSSKKISDFLKSQKINISPQVVLDYIGFLENSLMVYKVKRKDLRGKKHFEIGEKYYFEDIGLRNSIVGFNTNDINKILENVVFLHLKIAGYTVSIGVEGNKEIDFIAQKGGEKIYVQVAYLLENENTIKREFGNLLEVHDNFQKYVVTMDQITEMNDYLGIKRMHIIDFCTMLVK